MWKGVLKSIQSPSHFNCLLFHVILWIKISPFIQVHWPITSFSTAEMVQKFGRAILSQSLSTSCFQLLWDFHWFLGYRSSLHTVWYNCDEGYLGCILFPGKYCQCLSVCRPSVSRQSYSLCNLVSGVEHWHSSLLSFFWSFIQSKHSEMEWWWEGGWEGKIFQRKDQEGQKQRN